MKDWSDLEERYQDMRSEDPASAEDFKKAMTERFQKTVQVCNQFKKAFKEEDIQRFSVEVKSKNL